MSDDGSLFALLGIGLLAGASVFARFRGLLSAEDLAPFTPPPVREGTAMIATPSSRPGELQILGFYDPQTELLETVPGLTTQGQADLVALFQPREQREIGYDGPAPGWDW